MEKPQKKKSKALLIAITILICISSIITVNFFGNGNHVKKVQAIVINTQKPSKEKDDDIEVSKSKDVDEDSQIEFIETFKEFNLKKHDTSNQKIDKLIEEVEKYIEDIKKISIIKEVKITFSKININIREFFQFIDEFF
ncbi:hypothetical protein [Clostridium sp. UBA6640]|uniref:hypothetical protein n=1 Tax=Clostridium sp. UBA6640 TaxID=1946370 RepID=UPI0025C29088|nr:hypothetical protein [Clostridium sp. UBA6640]